MVHAIAGMSALASVIYLGHRKVRDSPHSIPLVALGMAILWFGWFGIAAGTVCYLAVMFKNRRKWDDALDVWGVHGIGGFTGIALLGIFSTLSVNPDGAEGVPEGRDQRARRRPPRRERIRP